MKLEIKPVENQKSFKPTETAFNEVSGNASEVLKRGIEAANSGNRHEARTLLMRVTETDPKNETAWLWLASISDYPEELFVFLQNVLAINPENQRAIDWTKQTKTLLAKNFVQRGIASSQENKKDAARQCFLQAILHDSQNEMAWLWLASIVDSAEEKTSHLQKVLSINPENESALSSLKMVNTQRASAMMRDANNAFVAGNRSRAKKLLGQLIKFDETYGDAWVLKAHLADSFDEKVAHFEHVLELNPNNEAARSGLASVKSVMQSFATVSNDEVEHEAVAQFEVLAEEPVSTFENVSAAESFEAVSQLEEVANEPTNAVENVSSVDNFETETAFEENSENVFDSENETEYLTNLNKTEEIADTHFQQETELESDVANMELPEQFVEEDSNSVSAIESVESNEFVSEEMVAETVEQEHFEVALDTNELAVESSPEVEFVQHEEAEKLEESILVEESQTAESVDESLSTTSDLELETTDTVETAVIDLNEQSADEKFSETQDLETQTVLTTEVETTFEEASSIETQELTSDLEELNSDMDSDSVLDSKILGLNVDLNSTAVQEEILDIRPVERENTQVGVYSFSKFRNDEVLVSRPEENLHQEPRTSELKPVFEESIVENIPQSNVESHQEQQFEEAPFVAAETEIPRFSKPVEVVENYSVNKIDHYSCPFCKHSNDISSSICNGCGSALGFSDLDSILNNRNVVSDLVYLSIQSMELDKLDGIFSGNDFMMLGLAYLNVKDLENARENLKVSLQINPINVSFTHILDEIENRTKKVVVEEKIEIVEDIVEFDENRRTIMVVDDSPTVRKLISSKLERHGHTVVSAVDGMDALAKINEIVPDLILLDITMPRLDGYQVCKLIKNNDATKRIPIVMISGKDGFFDKVRGKMAGSSGFISKPFGPEILMKTLEAFTK
jgi:CheY-like chemotaxis protein